MKKILCIATLDTKGPEVKYLKEVIEKRGYSLLVVDVSSGGDPFFNRILLQRKLRGRLVALWKI